MKTGMLLRLAHRRIWNILLLVTFLVTAILGLLLTIQINYKLEWSIVKKILKWHVDFGIGMSFISMFHLAWHWNFYTDMLKKGSRKGRKKENQGLLDDKRKPVSNYLILLSGFLSMIIQVLLMREITTVFQGNEILMIWTLGVWMFLNGAGVWLGSRITFKANSALIGGIIATYSILPLLIVPLLNILRNNIFPPGVLIHPAVFFLVIVLILLPICVLTGSTFSLLIKNAYNDEKGFVRIYYLEALGCVIGGLAVSFVLLYWLTILQSFIVIAGILQISLYFLEKKKGYLFGSILIFLLFIAGFIFPYEKIITSQLYSNQNVIESKETFYGNITITQKSSQYNFYENGNLLFTSQNNIVSEEYVHYAMLQHPMPRKVLLVSGGVSGMLDEVIKYPQLESLEYIELNPELVRMAGKYFPVPDDPRIHIVFGDIRKYLNNNTHTYDVAIMALPDPASLQINRMYTEEFVRILYQRMNPGGIVIYGLSPSGNYMSDIQRNTSALMFNTLKACFKQVLVIPGERDYYLASDSALTCSISKLWTKNPVENLYVNSYYIDDQSISERSNFIRDEIAGINLVNTDNKPLPVFYSALNYLSQFHFAKEILWIIILVLLLIPLLLMRSLATGVYLAGFSGAAAELLLVFTFQVAYGFVYSAIGIIIALFMSGLVLGSLLARKIKMTSGYFRLVQVIMILYFLIFPLFFHTQKVSVSGFSWISMLLMILLPSSVIGFMYVSATKLSFSDVTKSAPDVYSADLAGAATGIITLSVVFLPILGISGTCFIIGALNVIGLLLGVMGYKGIARSR